MTIKTLFLSLLGSMLLGTILAQNCNYEVNETDKFTNERKLVTKAVQVTGKYKIPKILKAEQVEWSVKELRTKKYLTTTFQFALGGVAMAGTEVLKLLMDNNEVVTLQIKTHMPSYSRRKMNGVAVVAFDYIITDEQLSVLQKANVKEVRVEAVMNPHDYSITEGTKTKNIFKCLDVTSL